VTLKDAVDPILRFAGFANTFIGTPLDMAYLGDGALLAKFIKFLSLRPNRDVKNNAYLEITLAGLAKMVKYLAAEQPLRRVGLTELAAQIKALRKQLHRDSVVKPLDTNELIDKGEAVAYDQLVGFGMGFCGATSCMMYSLLALFCSVVPSNGCIRYVITIQLY
jgi:hypothetical protein